MTHVMIDLETLGTGMNAPLLEIGAVRFGITGIGESFSALIDLDSCFDLGARADGGTIAWWMQQSDQARNHVTGGLARKDITRALNEFAQWLGYAPDPKVWSNGANFDIPLIDQWNRIAKVPTMWKFWNARDTRTLFEAAGYRPPKRVTAHTAVADATVQAEDVIAAWKKLGIAA